MFYMLSRKGKDGQWIQMGIVIAGSIGAAATKIGATVFDVGPAGIWAELEDGFYLEEFGKITSLPNSSK